MEQEPLSTLEALLQAGGIANYRHVPGNLVFHIGHLREQVVEGLRNRLRIVKELVLGIAQHRSDAPWTPRKQLLQ